MDNSQAAFRANMRPDMEVVDLLERTLHSARLGHVRGLVVVAVNPLNETQPIFAGDLSPARSNALIGGLVRAAHKLTRET